MDKEFNYEEAKKNLFTKQEQSKQEREADRQSVLNRVIAVLKKEFNHSGVDVYLVGSILVPFAFSEHSDIDIVLKHFEGDRFDVWTKLEGQIERNVEIILFESCHFQEFVLKDGFKVV